MLKKQAAADSTKPSSKAKAADEKTAAKTATAPATAGSVKTEPKRLPPSTMAHDWFAAGKAEANSPLPMSLGGDPPLAKSEANSPLPLSLTGERLVSGAAPIDLRLRRDVSRPCDHFPAGADESQQHGDGGRAAGAANSRQRIGQLQRLPYRRGNGRPSPCVSAFLAPRADQRGGQVHLSDECSDNRDFQNYYHEQRDGNDGRKDCFNPCGNCGFFAGADYLYVRPTFSENTAYFRRNTSLDAAENLTVTDTVVHQDFDYNSSPRIFLGYRFCDCGGEIRFTYWNYDNSSSQTTGPATTDTIYAGQLEINTSVPGQQLMVDSHLNMNVYDIDYSKCVCYGGSKPCDPCNSCPLWTLKYSAGVRIADVRRTDDNILLPVDDLSVAGHISADFIGAGPRLGIEGRRYCRDGAFSFFARGNMALLLGEYDLKETRFNPTLVPGTTDNYFDSHARVIPVAEIELGGTYQVSQRISASVGYLFQAWWDLGAFEQIPGNVFLNPTDDSNIMSFDGLFARVEVCF